MVVETLDRYVDTVGSELEPLFQHRFLTPPYGYLLGFVFWPVNLSILSVWFTFLQADFPAIVDTAGGVVVLGEFVVLSMSSAVVMGVTAWNTPYERIRRHGTLLFLALLPAVLLFGLHFAFPITASYRAELGLSLFLAHEVSRILFLGPAIGLTFVCFSLVVFGFRYRFE